MSTILQDESLMPFGKYKGFKMANVPANYLIWLLDNNKAGKGIKEYIVDNEEILREEIRDREEAAE